MKKVVLLGVVAILSFSMMGCGKSEETPTEPEATITEVPTEIEEAATQEVEEIVEEVAGEVIEEEAIAETEGASSGNEAMDAYIKLSQATFDAMTESLQGVMEFKASGDGNTLKYEMKVLEDMGDAELAKAQVDAQMEAQKEQMEMVVEGLKAAGIEDPKFVVEYKDKDGNEIATFNFE